MATLPAQGGSEGTWGTELLTWLQASHEADGGHDNDQFVADIDNKLVFTNNGAIFNNSGFIFTT